METRPPTDPAATPRPPKQLRRRPSEGHLGGVCAGIAEYFGIDPVIVRIAAVVLAISGPGVPAYILAWIFVPEADDGAFPLASPGAKESREDRGAQAFGIVLIAIAVSVLWGSWWSPARRWLFPLGLIALGLWLVFRRSDASTSTAAPTATPPPPAAQAPSAPWGPPTPTAAEPAPADVTSPVGGEPAGQDVEADVTTAAPGPSDATLAGPLGPPSPPPPPWSGGPDRGEPIPRPLSRVEEPAARGRRRIVLPAVLGALLVWSGVAFLVGASLQTGLAIGLCMVGLGFVVGAFVGGSKALILPAIVLTGALITTTVLDIPLEGPIGQRTWVPETVDRLRDYRLSVGEGTVDLTELELPPGDRVEVRGSIGIGHLVVIVPDDVGLEIEAEASMGAISVFGREDAGWGPSVDRQFDLEAFDEVIALDLEVGIGQIEVVSDAGRDGVLRPRDQRLR